MLINNSENYGADIKFVSYTGHYPNLCHGVLTLLIDGKEAKFGHKIEDFDFKTGKFKDDNYSLFWSSGGRIVNYNCAHQGEWMINVEDLPEQYRKYAAEIDKLFNGNVPYGCCGGCL